MDDTTTPPTKPKRTKPAGSGRKPGTTNKMTADVRAAIAEIVQGQASTFLKKMKAIKDPKQYCDVYLKLAEFNIPKLAKVEQTIRHAVTAEDMTDAELQAIAGTVEGPDAAAADRPGPGSRTH